MGEVYYGVHEEIAKMLAKKHNLTSFVETGTWHGDSAKWAAPRFEKVITIEVIEEFYLESKRTLSEYWNVLCVHGDSRYDLNRILRDVERPALFWLDAHWTGHPNYKAEYGKCAVLDEIKTINYTYSHDAIMVDDVRLFPSLMRIEPDEVIEALSFSGRRKVTVKDDIFYAEPNSD